MRKEIAQLWNLVEPYVKGAGFDLIELQSGREEGGWVVRVFIERSNADSAPRLPGATEPSDLFSSPSISHEDCERVSRDLSAALDVADLIPHAYRLEISSPGIDRPLRREEDFRRFSGQQVKLRTLDPVAGRRNFAGTIKGASGGVIELECGGQPCRVPIELVARANLVPDWDAEFRRVGSGQDSPDRPPRGRVRENRSHRSAS